MKKKLFENTIALAVVQTVNYVAPLAILPYLTRILGTEGFGIVAISMSLCVMVGVIIDYGFGMSGAYWIARNKNNVGKVRKYISAVISAKFFILLLILMLSIIASILYSAHFKKYQGVLIFIIINAIAQVITPVWIFQGLEKMKMITIFMVTAKIFYVLFIFLFIHNAGDEGFVIFSLALSNMIGAILGVYLIYREGIKFRKVSIKRVWVVLKESSQFFVSKSASGIYTSASSLIVGWFGGVSQAGVFSSAEKLYQAGQNVSSPVTQALYPYMARTGDLKVFCRVITALAIPLISGCSVLFYFSDQVITIFYGDDFLAASKLLSVFLVISVVNFFSNNFGYPLFSIINKLDIVNKTTLVGVLIYIILVFLLVFTRQISAINITYSILFVESILALSRFSLFIYFYKHRVQLDCEKDIIN